MCQIAPTSATTCELDLSRISELDRANGGGDPGLAVIGLDNILHHFDTRENHCLLVQSFQGSLLCEMDFVHPQ